MFNEFDTTTFDDVPAPAHSVDVEGLSFKSLVDALHFAAKGFWASSARGLRYPLTTPLTEESAKELRKTLGIRFQKLSVEDDEITQGALSVSSYNARSSPWFWRPGLAERVVEILRENPSPPQEIEALVHLRREARRESAFCEFVVTELNSGAAYTLEEHELRAFIFALYLACPYPGGLPDWKFIFSPHEGDLERFANTLGVAVGVCPDSVSSEGQELKLFARTGVYDFRYSLPGLDKPLSMFVFEHVTERLREGAENPWDTRELVPALQEESERKQREFSRNFGIAGRVGSVTYTVLATMLTLLAGGNGAVLAKAPGPPIHFICHAGVELAAAAAALRRRRGEDEEEVEEAAAY